MDAAADLRAKDNYGDTVAHLFAIAIDVSSEDFQSWVNSMMDIGQGQFLVCGAFVEELLCNLQFKVDNLIQIQLNCYFNL